MKKLLLILLLVSLTGCSVDYNLEFNGNTFVENIKIGKFEKNDIPEFDYLQMYAIDNLDNQEFYDVNYFNKYLTLKYKYDYDEFRLSNVFNSCYDNSSITYDDNYYYIITSDKFECLDYLGYSSDEVIINFKTDYLVEESNADVIKGKVHTWIVNADNYNDKKIRLKIHKEKYYNNSFWDNLREGKYINSFTIFSLMFIVLFVICYLLKKKGDIKNKI